MRKDFYSFRLIISLLVFKAGNQGIQLHERQVGPKCTRQDLFLTHLVKPVAIDGRKSYEIFILCFYDLSDPTLFHTTLSLEL